MEFSIIVAVDKKNGIGKDGQIPWKSSLDLRFFKKITTGECDCLSDFTSTESKDIGDKTNALIMGRKTADSLKAPLPGRLNLVISSQDSYRDGFVVFPSLTAALASLKKRKDIHRVFVIGGARLYEEGIKNNWCRTIFVTHIQGDHDCDVRVSNEFMQMLSSFQTRDHLEINTDSVLDFSEYVYQNCQEQAYLDLGKKIMEKGHYRQNRNAKTYSLFGEKLEFDVSEREDGTFEVPILTTKSVFTRGVNTELLFFMNGKTDTLELEKEKIMIWNGNTCPEFLKANGFDSLKPGEMGPMYGFIWRHFGAVYQGAEHDYTGEGVDQLQDVITKLVENPTSRRIVMTTYNPAQADQGVLYPCHGLMTQFYVEGDNRISLQTYQRSADYFLGLPFNIMSYSVFLILIVKLVNAELERRGESKRYSTGRMITILGDVHIYSDVDEETGEGVDHIQAVEKQLERYDQTFRFPRIRIERDIRGLSDLLEMNSSDIKVLNYARHSPIRAEMVA